MSRRSALFALSWSIASASAAEAQPKVSASSGSSAELPDLPAAITFEGLPCVDEAALEERAIRLVRPDRLNPARKVHGVVTAADPGRVVEFEVLEGTQLVGRRRLVFDSQECAPFEEAVELVLAMLLEGQGFEPPVAEPPVSEPPPHPPPKPESPPPPPPPPSNIERPRVTGRFRLAGELALDVFPAPSAGIRLEGGVDLSVPIALVARATWHFEDAIPIEGGGRLEFGGYRLAAMACYLHRRSWILAGCAGLGFVSIHATGVDVPGARSDRFDHGAAILGMRAIVPLARSWSLDFGAEVEAWFSRPEYVVLTGAAPRTIATASGVPVIAWLGLGYAF